MTEFLTIKLQNSRLGTIRPTTMNSAIAIGDAAHCGNLSFWNFQEPFPISDTVGRVSNRNKGCRGAIAGLLFCGRPTAIVRLVISIIVDAVNGISFRGPLSHIGKKVLETITPAVADLDPPTSISVVFMMLGIKASTFHLAPDKILSCFAAPVKALSQKAVGFDGFGSAFSLQAAATRLGFSKIGPGGSCLLPAIALAQPHGVSLLRQTSGLMQNDKSAKTLARKINKFSHWASPSLCRSQYNLKFGT